jgi:cytochrome P450
MLLDEAALYRDGIPHAAYDRIRSEHPIHFNSGPHPFYAILSHAHAAAVLQDTATYSSALQGILIEDASAQTRAIMRAMLPFADPPEHTDLRQKLSAPLMPSHLQSVKSQLESLCDDLVAQAVREREIDFVHRLAAEISLAAFGLLTGLERAQLEPLRAPSDCIIENGINESGAALAELCRCLEEIVAERRRAPRPDYMTRLAQVEFADRAMTPLERNGMLIQIVIGGLETTRNAMAGLLVALSDHPAQWKFLRTTPNAVANAVEESLRYVSPVNYLRRTTARETRLGDVGLPANARIVVFIGAANRDPARFTHPHALDLQRANARQHLALGAGAHFCMGAGLARMQLNAFWSAFRARVAHFELRAACERGGLIQQNLIRKLPVRLQPMS